MIYAVRVCVCVCRQGFGRRSSFLYQSDSEDLEDVGVNMKKRGPSQNSSGHVGDETYVTPFAQVSVSLAVPLALALRASH